MRRLSVGRIGFVLAVAALASGAGLILRAEPPQAVGSWASIGASPENRVGAAAVALPDGRTLLVGGLADGVPTDVVTVFNPAAGSFASAGQLSAPRTGHTATLLADGRVLIAGGTVNDLLTGDLDILDLSNGTSTSVATLIEPRSGHAAARLADGTVLIAGGTGTDGVLQTAEIFDPATGTVSPAGSPLLFPRTGASATTLIEGRVLIAGGNNGAEDLASAEIYSPATQSFQATDTNLDVPRSGHTAVLLPHNNGVLIAGGVSNGIPQASADLFLPAQFPDPYSYGMGQFTPTGAMAAPRSGAAGGPHVEGYAFAVGGGSANAEVYRFATIKTDKDDYAPGEFAVITGSGWQPNEEVTLLFQEDPAVHADYVLTLAADADGNIYHDQWAPEEHDLGVRFYLMAIGAQSRAQTTFTDAVNLKSLVSSCNGTEIDSFSTGSTVCMEATGLGGGGGTFVFKWWAPGLNPATDAPTRSQSVTTNTGNARDTFTVFACGTWNARIFDSTGTTLLASDTSASGGGAFAVTDCGTIIINKTAIGGNDTFGFSTTGGGGLPASFSITTSSGAGSKTFSVPSGTYSVSEAVPSGWDLSSSSCTSGSPASFTVSAGGTITCTFTNTKRGHLIVDKVTAPSGDPTSFSFTAGGTGYTSFSLTDAAAPNDQSLAPGTYSITEVVPSGWDLAASCVGGSFGTGAAYTNGGSIVLGAGETITCTFTDTKRGHLIVDKVTVPSGDSTSFSFTAGGTGYASFSLTDAAAPNDQSLAPGTYSITEVVPSGWDLAASCVGGSFGTGAAYTNGGSIVLGAGQTVTCTFTNTKRGAIKIVKNTVGGNGTFSFTSNFGVSSLTTVGNTASQTVYNLVPGSGYSISETVPTGWDLNSFTCDNGTIAAITVAPGATTTCTATNTKRGQILVVKQTLPDGDTTLFDFTASYNMSGFQLKDNDQPNDSGFLTPGLYDVSEVVPAGWAAQSVLVSNGTGTVTTTATAKNITGILLTPGAVVTVTFTNFRGSFATNSSLCAFDRDTSRPGQQFREIFTQDVQNFPSHKMTATNPGQFFYNVFYSGEPGNMATFNITLPYPFVTQGAQPIHAYSSVSTTVVNGETCFVPAGNFFNGPQQVTLASYTNGTYQNQSDGNSVGTTPLTVTLKVPASGFIYLNMHLDYGLKGSIGYGNSNNNAVQFTSISTPPLVYLVPDLADHMFSVSGSQTGSSTTENVNSFKKNPGVGGLVRTSFGQTPIQGATVTLRRGTTVVTPAVLSDEDGWYQIVYKHTGKEASYTVTLSNVPGKPASYTQTTTVTLKANAYFNIDFTVP